MSIRTLIVDDEPLARTGMSDFVGRVDFLEEVGQARSGLEALTLLRERAVDLLLLDIQMPGLSGIELVETLAEVPAVVFTTAHPSFAVKGFELDAVDYLLKPIAFPRFLRAVLKVRERLAASPPPAAGGTPAVPAAPPPPAADTDIFVREEGRVERIRTEDILYAEAMQNYCRIHTTGRSYLPLLPLSELLASLPSAHFVQIHRSYLINLRRADGVVGNQVRVGDQLLPISRSKREEVIAQLIGDRLL